MRKSSMVVLSGGQDSTTCLLWAKEKYEVVHAITFDYGQRHRAELSAAASVAAIVGVDSHETVDVRGMLQSRSPLTDPSAELETYTDFASMDATIGGRVELTFVPLRNPFFLLIAANHALQRDCYTLVTGVCQADNANYPDCTAEFIADMQVMINTALGLKAVDLSSPFVTIETPLIDFSKAQTVDLAMSYTLGRLALAYTHTCYAGEVPPCGVCHACVLRAEGFRLAGVPDPLLARFRTPDDHRRHRDELGFSERDVPDMVRVHLPHTRHPLDEAEDRAARAHLAP